MYMCNHNTNVVVFAGGNWCKTVVKRFHAWEILLFQRLFNSSVTRSYFHVGEILMKKA